MPISALRDAARSRAGYRTDVQFLRAISVALVVLFHAGVRALSGGFIGVDVFFVISGYLIIPSLFARMSQHSRGAVWEFYARRIKRLLPALMVMIGVTLLVIMPLLSPIDVKGFSKTAASVLLYASNWYFIGEYGTYFSPGAASDIFLHTWSLSVEEQFYIAAPIVIYLLSRLTGKIRPVRLLMILSACSLIAAIILTPRAPSLAFFSPFTRAWEFGIGGCAAMLASRDGIAPRRRWSLHLLIVASLLCILASAFYFTAATAFPGYAATLPAGAAAIFLFCCGESSDQLTALNRGFAAPIFQFFGNISYSLYLWHWPVIVMVTMIYDRLSTAQTTFCIGLSVLLACASYAWVEEPLRHHSGGQRIRSGRVIALGGVSMALALLFAFVVFMTGSMNLKAYPVLQESRREQYIGPAIENLPGCMPPDATAELRVCEFGDRRADKRMVLFGDSHARQWFYVLDQWAVRSGYRLTIIARSACTPIEIHAMYIENWRLVDTTCLQWREAAINKILALHPQKLLIITSRWPLEHEVSYQDWERGLNLTLPRFTTAGIETYLVAGTPLLPHDPGRCLASHFAILKTAYASCNETLKTAMRVKTGEVETRAVQAIALAHYLDFPIAACNEQTCELVADGIVVFRDVSHFTERYIEHISPRLLRYLESLLGS